MDNTVFERNYEKPQEDMEYCTAVFEQAVEGGFFQRYCDMVDKVPKMINPQDKENYEYLVNRCDQYAKRHYGRISAVVDYERWDSKINLYLPMLEFATEEDIDKGHCHNHIIFNAVNFVDFHSYRSNKRTYRELRQLSDEICKEHGLSVIPPSQGKGMDYKEYTEAKRGTSWKQKLRQTIDRMVITAKDWDEFLKLMQESGYEIKPGKYISFRAEGQERFTRAKTIGENYTEERLKERIAGRNPRKQRMQTERKGISLIIDIQNSIKVQESKGYEHWAKIHNLQEAARTISYLTENGLLRYTDLEAKVEDIHSSYDRTGTELKAVESRLREVQPLIKNISNYQRLKSVYEAYQRAKDKAAFRSTHEAELVIFEAARSTLLAIQGEEQLPSLKSLRAEQEQLAQEQQRLYEKRASLKKQAKQIDTIRANVISYLNLSPEQETQKGKEAQRE